MGRFEFNPWVIAGIVLLAVVLGILNNYRVFEECRVNLFGSSAAGEVTE